MDGKKQATLFRKTFKLNEINSASLCDAIRKQGYTIVEFNGISDDSPVADLIDALHLKDLVSQSRCFTYHDSNNRLVFIHEDLNEEERTIVLAHEEGHIWNRHLNHGNVIGTDVVQEHEANEFAHYLLIDRDGSKKRKNTLIASCLFAVALLSILLFSLKSFRDATIYTENLYRVSDGKKYHLRDCNYIKDRKDVYRLTIEEFESGEYEPCSVCRPEQHQ